MDVDTTAGCSRNAMRRDEMYDFTRVLRNVDSAWDWRSGKCSGRMIHVGGMVGGGVVAV